MEPIRSRTHHPARERSVELQPDAVQPSADQGASTSAGSPLNGLPARGTVSRTRMPPSPGSFPAFSLLRAADHPPAAQASRASEHISQHVADPAQVVRVLNFFQCHSHPAHAFHEAMQQFGMSSAGLLQLFRRVGVTEHEALSGMLPPPPLRWQRLLQNAVQPSANQEAPTPADSSLDGVPARRTVSRTRRLPSLPASFPASSVLRATGHPPAAQTSRASERISQRVADPAQTVQLLRFFERHSHPERAFDEAMQQFGMSRHGLLQLFRRVGVTEREALSGTLPSSSQRWQRILDVSGRRT